MLWGQYTPGAWLRIVHGMLEHRYCALLHNCVFVLLHHPIGTASRSVVGASFFRNIFLSDLFGNARLDHIVVQGSPLVDVLVLIPQRLPGWVRVNLGVVR